MKDTKEQAKKQDQDFSGINFGINADDSLSGTTHLNEPVVNEPDMEKLQAELEDMKDKFLRKVAEFDNFRKRSSKERIELIQTAGKEVIIDLLEVLDHHRLGNQPTKTPIPFTVDPVGSTSTLVSERIAAANSMFSSIVR